MKKNTREKLLQHAENLFSEKGFYGASINDVAKEVDVSKQALLHHFPTKETLYAEVLQRAALQLSELLAEAKLSAEKPVEQLNRLFKQMSSAEGQSLRVIILLSRELLDNRERAEESHKWFMRPFLDGLVDMVKHAQKEGYLVNLHPLAFIYQMLGASQYYLISQPTLKQLYSAEECDEHRQHHLKTIDMMFGVKTAFKA